MLGYAMLIYFMLRGLGMDDHASLTMNSLSL
jgi:hypothetical protein